MINEATIGYMPLAILMFLGFSSFAAICFKGYRETENVTHKIFGNVSVIALIISTIMSGSYIYENSKLFYEETSSEEAVTTESITEVSDETQTVIIDGVTYAIVNDKLYEVVTTEN